MVTTERLLTYEDLLNTPDDGRRHEIIGGRLVVTASPLTKHQRVSVRLAAQLFDLERAGLGVVFPAPTDVRLEPHEIFVPDMVFITTPRLDIVRASLIEGPPDLIVEVRSPTTAARDDGEKKAVYQRTGVQEYWRADPDLETVQALILVDGAFQPIPPVGNLIRSLVVPEFVVDVEALLAGLR
jgi:Uma2 family endonuclease